MLSYVIFLCFSKRSAWQFSPAQNPKQNYLSLQFSAFSRWIAMCKRWTQCAAPICCTQELKSCNFPVKFKVILVASTEFLTFGHRIRFFWVFSDYSKANFALLACQPKSLISIAFFIKVMWFYEKEIITVRFFPLSHHFFHFVCTSRCVTHGVRGAPAIILLQAIVLIVRAETPGLAKKKKKNRGGK